LVLNFLGTIDIIFIFYCMRSIKNSEFWISSGTHFNTYAVDIIVELEHWVNNANLHSYAVLNLSGTYFNYLPFFFTASRHISFDLYLFGTNFNLQESSSCPVPIPSVKAILYIYSSIKSIIVVSFRGCSIISFSIHGVLYITALTI
jgi:hypothetical protein